MADKKISELVNLTSLAADDEFVVVDADANATKRTTYDTLATEIRTEAEALSGTTATFSGNVTAQANLGVDGTLSFDSGYGSTATAYGCRAWVNFDGTGSVSIRDSGNVSSVVDTAVGAYTVNFANSLPDANYSVVGMCARTGAAHATVLEVLVGSQTTSDVDFQVRLSTSGGFIDPSIVSVVIHR